MKKFLLVIGLVLGIVNAGIAQSSNVNSLEYRVMPKKTKQRKQIKHFEQPKKDKKMRSSGTTYKYRMSRKSQDGCKVKMAKAYKNNQVRRRGITNDYFQAF